MTKLSFYRTCDWINVIGQLHTAKRSLRTTQTSILLPSIVSTEKMGSNYYNRDEFVIRVALRSWEQQKHDSRSLQLRNLQGYRYPSLAGHLLDFKHSREPFGGMAHAIDERTGYLSRISLNIPPCKNLVLFWNQPLTTSRGHHDKSFLQAIRAEQTSSKCKTNMYQMRNYQICNDTKFETKVFITVLRFLEKKHLT